MVKMLGLHVTKQQTLLQNIVTKTIRWPTSTAIAGAR